MSHTALVLTHASLYYSALYAETLTNGIYCVLFVLCLLKLARDNSTPPRKNLKVLLLCLTVVMFCVGTAHLGIFLQQALSSARDITKRESRTHAQYEYIKMSLEVVNCFLGDFIIISTALTLEKIIGKTKARSQSHRAMLYAVPTLLLMASLAAGIGMVWTCDGVDVLSSVLSPMQRGWPRAWISLVLATNLVSTLVFVYEFVSRWKELKAENMIVVGGALKEFFITLMCSGALYCCTFIVLFVLFLIDSNVRYIVNHMIPQLAGIYPTAAIVIVAFSTNDPSIQLSSARSISKQPSRGFQHPASLKNDSRLSSPPSAHEMQEVAMPVSIPSPGPELYLPRRALEWFKAKFPWGRSHYPRKGSTFSTSTAVHVAIEVEVSRETNDERCTSKRMRFPPLARLCTDLKGLNDYSLEGPVEEQSKRRSVKFDGPEEDSISPHERYTWDDNALNHVPKEREDIIEAGLSHRLDNSSYASVVSEPYVQRYIYGARSAQAV